MLKKRMKQRGVKFNEIIETIYLPDYVINKGDIIESYKEVNGKNLKIVYSRLSKFIKIITIIVK